MAQGANTHGIAAMKNAAWKLSNFGNLAAYAQIVCGRLLTKTAVERICRGLVTTRTGGMCCRRISGLKSAG
jgi:hypothetical protein